MGWQRVFRRAGRRTNLGLLVLLLAAFLTGWLAFAAGTPVPAELATVAHGLLGMGLVALVPWKTVVVRRAPAIRLASGALLLVILTCLVAGFVEVFVGYRPLAGLSPIQVHVGAALVAVPLVAGHVLRHRRQRFRRSDASRRALLRTGALALGTGAGYLLLEGVGRWTHSPAASRVATGSHRLAADDIPATIWLLDRVPDLDPASHRVDVAGTAFTPETLRQRAGAPVTARLDCTGGWYAEAHWTGVALADLIAPERLVAAASLVVTSTTGYARRFPVAEASSLWLATDCEGRPLTAGTGAPVRLVAPHRRGFWWVKWIASVELSGQPAWSQLPFPLQ